MALVYRNGRPRLQRSVRRGGRVTSKYIGAGETALLMHEIERADRIARDDDRQRERDAEHDRQRATADIDRRLDELANEARTAAHALLTAAGYHLHRRSEWRRRRARTCKAE